MWVTPMNYDVKSRLTVPLWLVSSYEAWTAFVSDSIDFHSQGQIVFIVKTNCVS